VAEADLPDVQRALEACPQKICASLRGSLGTPIHVAAAHGRAECVQLLVQQATALALASSKYDPNNQRMFVAYRMVNTGNDRKQTPLMLAAGQGHEQCVGLLLDLVG
jgi:ankyrin repeat protein